VSPFFKLSGSLEALSYLLLLFVAMPLKYVWHLPLYVRWTGSVHGALFLTFCLAIALDARAYRWPLKTSALAFASAFVPLGPWLFERRLRGDI
jgi:integral membrane protein